MDENGSKFDNMLLEIKEIKTESDILFKENSNEKAIKSYSNAISKMTKLFEIYMNNKKEQDGSKLIDEIGVPLYSNLSKCYFKTFNFQEAIKISTKIIEIKPDNITARYIRSSSCLEMNDIDTAKEDIKCIKQLTNENNSNELKLLETKFKEKEKLVHQKEKVVFNKMIKGIKYTENIEENEFKRKNSDNNSDKSELDLGNGFSFLILFNIIISKILELLSITYNLWKNAILSLIKQISKFVLNFIFHIKELCLDIIRFLISFVKVILTFPVILIYKTIFGNDDKK